MPESLSLDSLDIDSIITSDSISTSVSQSLSLSTSISQSMPHSTSTSASTSTSMPHSASTSASASTSTIHSTSASQAPQTETTKTRKQLPNTGETNSPFFTAAAMAVIVSTGVLYGLVRNKKSEETE